MTVQAFNPTDLSQSATNWTVAQRIVGNFAPHAQVMPNLTLALDPGNLLNGTTLTEVNAQSVGPFAPPASGFRIDRVVVDRSTGAAAIVTGAANSLTPPAIPTGKLPVARVMLLPTTHTITNDAVVDERALTDLTPTVTNSIICLATLGGSDQPSLPSGVYTKVQFSAAPINVGSAFNTSTSRFQPSVPGYYKALAQGFMNISANKVLAIAIQKNGVGISFSKSTTSVTRDLTCLTSGLAYLNGTTDYLEALVFQENGTATPLIGTDSSTHFDIHQID